VQERAGRYERWRDPPVSVDSSQPLDAVVAEVAAIVRAATGDP
jgi:hypothetical protein